MEQVSPATQCVLVVTGPTASGKTAVAVRIAELLGGEIISADSRQVYRDIDIGTAKPTLEERRGIPHYCIDIRDLSEAYTAGEFAREAGKLIEDMFARGVQPVVAGGSGLYVQALTEGIFEGPPGNPELRAALERRIGDEGVDSLWDELLRLDPDCVDFVPKTNFRRVIRALEVCLLTGEAYSRIRRERMVEPAFESTLYGLEWNRSVLYSRINMRVQHMLDSGLLEEARKLIASGADPKWQALNTVGYKEAFAFLAGEITREEMIEKIRQHTRNYAKRQWTWFRNKDSIRWVATTEPLDIETTAQTVVHNFRSTMDTRTRTE